ncbi:hypothetical protein BC938DRAFT_481591 [Jimgerdemannia flammicorona]|uniref:Uncharacterized protein n=1 Tax=Jimgerdemannia flammicorona TaxID=994334 RepID=A0A433R0I2_9FUNG|nr:hypothetical protein BC938DRAFT_481591 [Jimgerdemannia flammicorona]
MVPLRFHPRPPSIAPTTALTIAPMIALTIAPTTVHTIAPTTAPHHSQFPLQTATPAPEMNTVAITLYLRSRPFLAAHTIVLTTVLRTRTATPTRHRPHRPRTATLRRQHPTIVQARVITPRRGTDRPPSIATLTIVACPRSRRSMIGTRRTGRGARLGGTIALET